MFNLIFWILPSFFLELHSDLPTLKPPAEDLHNPTESKAQTKQKSDYRATVIMINLLDKHRMASILDQRGLKTIQILYL